MSFLHLKREPPPNCLDQTRNLCVTSDSHNLIHISLPTFFSGTSLIPGTQFFLLHKHFFIRRRIFHHHHHIMAGNTLEISPASENSPVEQVALTVPTTDDPSIPVLTFRMWVLGTLSCVLLSFLNQFFWYRKEPLSITSISAQIAVVPLGHLMASWLPTRVFFQGSKWEFSLNRGPFNVKEHVLITIFANSGAGTVYAIHVVTAVKIFYKKTMTFFVAFLVVLTTQVGFCKHIFFLVLDFELIVGVEILLILNCIGFGIWMGRDLQAVLGRACGNVVAI